MKKKELLEMKKNASNGAHAAHGGAGRGKGR